MSGETRRPIALLIMALLATSVADAAGKPVYRWVDEKGQVHYGDKVLPSESKQGRETINRNGIVSKVIPRELTGDELVQAQNRRAAEKAAAEAQQQRLVYDRALLQSFNTVAELQAMREERLASVEARQLLAEKAVQDNEKTLADLRSRSGDKAPEGPLKVQIETFEASLIDNLQLVRKLRDEHGATVAKYAYDMDRFKALRAGTIRQGD